MKKKALFLIIVALVTITGFELSFKQTNSEAQLFLQNVEALAELEAAKEVHTCYQRKDYEVGGSESHYLCESTDNACPSSKTKNVNPDWFHDDYRCFVY